MHPGRKSVYGGGAHHCIACCTQPYHDITITFRGCSTSFGCNNFYAIGRVEDCGGDCKTVEFHGCKKSLDIRICRWLENKKNYDPTHVFIYICTIHNIVFVHNFLCCLPFVTSCIHTIDIQCSLFLAYAVPCNIKLDTSHIYTVQTCSEDMYLCCDM